MQCPYGAGQLIRVDPDPVGLVVEVPGRRRVFLPLSRVTAIEPLPLPGSALFSTRPASIRERTIPLAAASLTRSDWASSRPVTPGCCEMMLRAT